MRSTGLVFAAALSIAGLALLFEVGSAIRSNLLWLDRVTLADTRFCLYLWIATGATLLLLVKGIAYLRLRACDAVIWLEAVLAITVAIGAIVAVHGWRIRTDVGPLDPIDSLAGLPAIVRFYGDARIFYAVATIISGSTVMAFYRSFRMWKNQ